MTKNTYKVTPGSRSNFSKLRKFLSGGSPTLDNAFTQNIDLGVKIPDVGSIVIPDDLQITALPEKWRSSAYLKADHVAEGTENNPGNWNKFYDINKIVNTILNDPNYNSEVTTEKLNQLLSLTASPGLNWTERTTSEQDLQEGFENWNKLFNLLFPRINHDIFGYIENVANYLGVSTWNRRAVLNELQERLQRGEKLHTSSGDITVDSSGNFVSISSDPTTVVGPAEQARSQINPYDVAPDSPVEDQKQGTESKSKKFPLMFTDPIINGAILGNSLMNNIKNYNLAKLKKAPLLTPVIQNVIRYGDYDYQTAAKNAEANALSSAARRAESTSNADLAYATLLEADLNNFGSEQTAALHQAQKDELELLKAQLIENQNLQNQITVEDINKKALIAKEQADINAKTAMNDANNAAILDNILKNHTAYGNWLQRLRLNRSSEWHKRADFLKALDLKQAKKDYENAIDFMQSPELAAFIASRFTRDSNGKYTIKDPYTNATNSKYSLYSELGLLDRGLSFDQIANIVYSNASSDRTFGDIVRAYQERQKTARLDYEDAIENILQYYSEAALPIDNLSIDNQGALWMDGNYSIPVSYYQVLPTQYKQGGRFLEYLEHNRKIQEKNRDLAMLASKQNARLLERDLDAIDRETLLLLRSIFK